MSELNSLSTLCESRNTDLWILGPQDKQTAAKQREELELGH